MRNHSLLLLSVALVSGCIAAPDEAAPPAGGDAGAPVVGEADAAADPGGADAGPGVLPACPTYATATTAGMVAHPSVNEASGVVESRQHAGVLWVHNDSGDQPTLYAVSTAGVALATYGLEGASAIDWEDLAAGPGPMSGASYLYVGDIGDNAAARATVTLYRIAEPTVPAAGGIPATGSVTSVEQFTLAYPDSPHNAETLLVDPTSGDVYIVAKAGSGESPVFRAAAPLSSSGAITMEQVATLTFGVAPLPGNTLTTGGDISPAGDAVAIRTYDSAFLWRRAAGATIADALATEPCPIPLASEGQGEALGFARDGLGYYTMSEGTSVPIHVYAPL